MTASENEQTAVSQEGVPRASAELDARPSSSPLQAVLSAHRRGPGSLVNLSLYAAGLSGLWTALGTPLLPIKVEEILANGGSTILGFTFDESDKNGALGIVSLAGLAIAALIQPIAGVLSDRRSGPAKRMPFLLIGTVGMGASVMFLGIVGTLLSLILLNLLIQGMGNLGQGAANGLIADHIAPGRKGAAAGALNLSRVIGAGLLTGIVFLMMSRYDVDSAPGWMIASLALIASVAVLTSLWTVTSLWLNGDRNPTTEENQQELAYKPQALAESDPETQDNALPHDNYLRFLIALTIIITGFSSLQLYSFFYLEDVIGLENAADGGVVILLTVTVATALTVLPAGGIADRVGRDPMLYFGGFLGVTATIILMFANSVLIVAIVGLMIGVVIGIFLTVSWALANDLVSRRHAARDLAYASVAVLVGSATSRISGIGVDRLNEVQDALGYQVVLGAVAFCFMITVALMTRLSAEPKSAQTDKAREHSLAD